MIQSCSFAPLCPQEGQTASSLSRPGAMQEGGRQHSCIPPSQGRVLVCAGGLEPSETLSMEIYYIITPSRGYSSLGTRPDDKDTQSSSAPSQAVTALRIKRGPFSPELSTQHLQGSLTKIWKPEHKFMQLFKILWRWIAVLECPLIYAIHKNVICFYGNCIESIDF